MESKSSQPLSNPPSLLKGYLQFLRSPNLIDARPSLSFRRASNHILRLYSLHLLILIVVGIIINQFINQQDSLLLESFSELSAWLILGMAVIFAPVIEESLFRLPLRGTKFNLIFSLSLVALIGVPQLNAFPMVMLGLILLLVGINFYLWSARSQDAKAYGIYRRFPRPIFYVSALAFGIIHIGNYDASVWFLLPLLVLPQFLLGLYFGFIRLRYGFGWAILTHGFHNGCILLPIFLTKLLGSAQLQTQMGRSADLTNLSLTDKVITVGIGFYTVIGLGICGVTAWKLVQEYLKPQVDP